uniref:A-kinase anchor protein 2 n=1 Tax=Phallusia mammillata TaxID=59560 RepID=A0A6F9D6W3_9ASCI|nr:A-kinase anchor protein 2 [Phallusia mammillata]
MNASKMSLDSSREAVYKRASALRERWNTLAEKDESKPSDTELRLAGIPAREKEMIEIKNQCLRIDEDLKILQSQANAIQEQIGVRTNTPARTGNAHRLKSVERKASVTKKVTSSARDELEQRLRMQDVLAKISPRYMLQYKIDLALQKIYQDDMDEQAEGNKAYPDANTVERELTSSNNSDAEDEIAQGSQTHVTRTSSRNSSVTSSSSSSDSEDSAAPQTEMDTKVDFLETSDQNDVDDMQPIVVDDVTEATSPPVPKPRKRQASKELFLESSETETAFSDDQGCPETNGFNTQATIQTEPELEPELIEDAMTSPADSASILERNGFEVHANQLGDAEQDDASNFDHEAVVESAADTQEGQTNTNPGESQTSEEDHALEHPVSKHEELIGSDADQKDIDGDIVSSKADSSSSSSSSESGDSISSVDELDDTRQSYTYQVNLDESGEIDTDVSAILTDVVNGVDKVRESEELSNQNFDLEESTQIDGLQTEERVSPLAKTTLVQEAKTEHISIVTDLGNTTESVEQDDNPPAPLIVLENNQEYIESVPQEKVPEPAAFVLEDNKDFPAAVEESATRSTDEEQVANDELSSSISSVNSSEAGDSEPNELTIDPETTSDHKEPAPRVESIVTTSDHAETLARVVVIDGINEAVAVNPRSSSTTGANSDPEESRFKVTEQGYDIVTSGDTEEMQSASLEPDTEQTKPIEIGASTQEVSNDQALFSAEAKRNASTSSESSSSSESVSTDEHEAFLDQVDTEEVFEPLAEHAKESAKPVSEEASVPEDKEDTQEADKEEEMRIIERTGLINRDEQTEDQTKAGYSAAHSQRNTDATKWFGEPKPKDKVWLKPKGKVDDDAEAERRKVIKAMTRKHNPNIVPKWKPPPEKDFKDNLDEHQKESLRKYEERRRNRIESEGDPVRLRAESFESFAGSQTSESSSTSALDKQEPKDQPETKVVGNSEIVFEPVVHSKDAISVWESRLSNKFEKENTEKKRLSVGKQRRAEWEAKRRERSESISSVTSSSSVMSDLPASENIIRESLGVSNVRNRWKDMEHSTKKQPPAVSPKPPTSRRTQSFTVKSASPYRSFGRISNSPKPEPVNSHVTFTQSRPGESQIDREIREAAEREEMWRTEKKRSESSDQEPARSPTPNQTPNEEISQHPAEQPVSHTTHSGNNDEVVVAKKVPVEEALVTPIKVRSQTMPNLDLNVLNHVVPDDEDDKRPTVDTDAADTGADSGIECNVTNAVTRSDVASPSSEEGQYPNSSVAPHSGHDEDYASSELSATSQDSHVSKEQPSSVRSPRALPTVLSPKGWNPKPQMISPVSPLPSSERSFVVNNHNNQSFPPPPASITNGHSEQEEEEKKDSVPELSSQKQEESDPTSPGGSKTTMVVTRQRSGPSFEILSSKSRLQTIMELEIKEAAKREEEWKNKQQLVESRSVEGSPAPTPTPTSPVVQKREPPKTPPVVHRRPVKVLPNGDVNEKLEAQKQKELSDSATKPIVTSSTAEYKKKSVVLANRVHRRKSNLAMQWEAGKFKNHEEEE